MGEQTIPILPCRTLQPVLDFYTALGFEVTFRQRSPNPYAVVERGGIQLQFFGMRQYEPAESFSTCYVRTDDVDGLYAAFRSGLKSAYGRIPTRGLPRIGPLKDTSYGVRQFLMTDPGGNCIRVGRPTSEDPSHRPAPQDPFARALHHASLFADSRDDPAGAAKIIDRVLGGTSGPGGPRGQGGQGGQGGKGGHGGLDGERPTPVQLFQLLVLRADVAMRLGDEEALASALARAAALRLDHLRDLHDLRALPGEERRLVEEGLRRLEDLWGGAGGAGED